MTNRSVIGSAANPLWTESITTTLLPDVNKLGSAEDEPSQDSFAFIDVTPVPNGIRVAVATRMPSMRMAPDVLPPTTGTRTRLFSVSIVVVPTARLPLGRALISVGEAFVICNGDRSITRFPASVVP